MVVPSSSIHIDPVKELAEVPAVNKNTQVRSVALQRPQIDWESALLDRGIEVLDRSSMPRIEREIFLQEARLPANGTERRKKFWPPQVGRDSFKLWGDHKPFWMLQNDIFIPLLNGRNVAADAQLPIGHHIAAQSLLDTSEFDVTIEPLERDAARPTAATIDYIPQVVTTLPLPPATEHTWATDAADPFHLTSKDGPVFFDPEANALWTLTDAWVGYEVSRDAYIARRTSTIKSFCTACARELLDKAQTRKPSASETPLRWKCNACADILPTRYLDGYVDGATKEDNEGTVAITIRPTWVAPKAGSYPILPANDAASTLRRAAATWARFDPANLVAATTRQALGLGSAHDWCHIDESLLATVMPQTEAQKLAAFFGSTEPSTDKFMVPAIHADGSQIYVLEREATKQQAFQVPVAHIRVEVRAIGVEDTRLLCSGTLRMSYLNLLTAPVELEVTADGLSTSKWPSLARQREELKKAACARIAAMLKP
jgi:hypothetical protein